MASRDWTRDQLLKALALYCQLPFGRMHSRNPAIVALASDIGRTPSALAMKLVNFASLDPELSDRGIRGMGNTSQADKQIWTEFYGKWEALAEYPLHIPITSDAQGAKPHLAVIKPSKGATELMREVLTRRGQSFFRAAVLAADDCRCCITGIACESLLRASHIIPWADNESLRLDPRNGLCLNALHDAAFDRGLISFSDQFELLVSARLKDEVPQTIYSEMFENRLGEQINFRERFRPTPDMLAYHRSKVFCG